MFEPKEISCTHQLIQDKGEPVRRLYIPLRQLQKNGLAGKHLRKNYPTSTPIHCWYCRLPFETQPIPIVKRYDTETKAYTVFGVTCGAPCAKSYLRDQREVDCNLRILWQSQMAVEIFGYSRGIPFSPPWQTIDAFGGSISIEKFRAVADIPEIESMVLREPPFLPYPIVIECEAKNAEFLSRPDPSAADQAAILKMGNESMRGLKRPDSPIDTVEKLNATHPNFEVEVEPSVFEEYIETEPKPTPAECKQIRENRIRTKKMNRKKKTLAAQSEEEEDEGEAPTVKTPKKKKTAVVAAPKKKKATPKSKGFKSMEINEGEW